MKRSWGALVLGVGLLGSRGMLNGQNNRPTVGPQRPEVRSTDVGSRTVPLLEGRLLPEQFRGMAPRRG